MANQSYMTIVGKKQGLISAGCSSQDSIGNKCQAGHEDEIMVLACSHNMAAGNDGTTSGGGGKHMPVVITKILTNLRLCQRVLFMKAKKLNVKLTFIEPLLLAFTKNILL